MKLIFLDVDGVLNSTRTARMYFDMFDKNGYGGFFNDDIEGPTYENVLWGQDLVDNLKRIVDETGAQIVISSTWRITHRWQNFPKMFEVYGWVGAPVIGATGRGGPIRGNEIQRILDVMGNPPYVILDDSTDMLESQWANFVNTDEAVGLTSEDADKAIAILQAA